MRGNWETAEPLVLAPGQHMQQQQQQAIVEEGGRLLHSPTTPAWGITDRIVKEEPLEDKNNDSGVSPGHYTSNSASPQSRRSSSTANCSLSPGSATSQDSNNMQCTFDYSPQSMYKTCGAPVDYMRHHSMDENQTEQGMDVVSNTMKPNDEAEVGQETLLQCPICTFATLNKLQFTEHLAGHCAASNCETPDFAKSMLGQIASSTSPGLSDDGSNRVNSPTQGDRSEEETDEPGVRVPRMNSQGKMKTFRCKQCNFVAITKLEFWEHSRGHIKAEKLLTCPKCPFVTEYKHHLEYHLRNHFGSKPFKCDKCSYSCVNKSMLNSHLKSHSNVYQYRCANCSYATKYCHSLKLHLRKYGHKPAMVLNADGSPNPLPIIDIYGTRRGPKQKTNKTMTSDDPAKNNNVISILQQQQQLQGGLPNHLVAAPLVVPPQISPAGHLSIPGLNMPANSVPPLGCFPYNQLFPGFPLTGHFESASEKHLEHLRANVLMEYAKVMNNGSTELARDQDGVSVASSPRKVEEDEEESEDPEHDKSSGSISAPLDLSKPESTSTTTGTVTTTMTTTTTMPVNSPSTRTNRRKGRAVKLDRRMVVENDSDEEMMLQEEADENLETQDGSTRGSKDEEDANCVAGNGGMNNEFTCQYCEIAFGNVVMYTVHMGYHGYKDPYTCNMCGHECTDKVSFFLHIARSKHS